LLVEGAGDDVAYNGNGNGGVGVGGKVGVGEMILNNYYKKPLSLAPLSLSLSLSLSIQAGSLISKSFRSSANPRHILSLSEQLITFGMEYQCRCRCSSIFFPSSR
jgi:hypothetical protein